MLDEVEEMYKYSIKTKHNSIPKVSKKDQSLKNPDVNRWYKHIARNSIHTAEVALRRLYLFCEKHNIEPMELINKNPKELKYMIIDHLNWMEDEGYAKSYQASILKAIKSWLRFNDISIDIPFKYGDTKLAKAQILPDEDEYTDIINRADVRSRAAIALISKAGLRPQVLGNHNASDGLRLRDIPDIRIVNNRAICNNYPCLIRVRAELSKNKKPYIACLSKQGARYVIAYLNDRIKHGEVITDDSPIVAKDHKHSYIGNGFLSTIQVRKIVRDAIKGYNIRPYDLRHWFATRLEIAVAKGKISSSIREELMGHISGIEMHYTYAKYNLPEDLVKELRDAYARAEEYIDVEIDNNDREEERLKEEAIAIIERMSKEELLNLLAFASKGKSISKW